jgi:hypothetical protein
MYSRARTVYFGGGNNEDGTNDARLVAHIDAYRIILVRIRHLRPVA